MGTKKSNNILIQNSDDWVVVFVNGERVHSGHRISDRDWKDILKPLGIKVETKYGQHGNWDGDFCDGDDTVFTED